MYTFTLLNMQSPRHCSDRQMARMHVCARMYEYEDVTVLWNQVVQTGKLWQVGQI